MCNWLYLLYLGVLICSHGLNDHLYMLVVPKSVSLVTCLLSFRYISNCLWGFPFEYHAASSVFIQMRFTRFSQNDTYLLILQTCFYSHVSQVSAATHLVSQARHPEVMLDSSFCLILWSFSKQGLLLPPWKYFLSNDSQSSNKTFMNKCRNYIRSRRMVRWMLDEGAYTFEEVH